MSMVVVGDATKKGMPWYLHAMASWYVPDAIDRAWWVTTGAHASQT
jgi:hypothetical protein